MRLTLSILFLLLLYTGAFCQTIIKGKVINGQGQAVPLSTINILRQNKTTIAYSAIADENGQFKIDLNDTLITNGHGFIFASYLKSKSDTILIDYKHDVTLTIRNDTYNLSEVSIKAELPVVTRKADRFVFTPNKQLTEGASSLDVIRISPLIQYDNKTDVFSIINRSGTIIYINGRKSNLPKEMIISLLRSTPADNIKNIEIITNPGSEYSANATGGVININFKRMANEGWSGNMMVGSEEGAFNTTLLNGSINYRQGKMAVRVSPFINDSYNYYTYTKLLEPTNGGTQNNAFSMHRKYFVLGGGVGLDYDIDKRDLLSFNGFISTVNGNTAQKSSTQYYRYGTSTIDSAFLSPMAGTDHYIYNFGNIYFQHAFDSTENKKLTINIDYNELYQKNNNTGEFYNVTLPVNTAQQYKNIFPNNFFNVSESVDYSSQIDKKSKVGVGAQFSNSNMSNNLAYYDYQGGSYNLNTTLSSDYKYRENYWAFYVNYTKTFSDKLNGIIGLRLERTSYSSANKTIRQTVDSTYTNLFPNLSLSYNVSKNSNLSLSVSKKIKRPQIDMLFPGRTYYDPNYFSENNPLLQPSIAYNSELLYSIHYQYFFTIGYSFYNHQFDQFVIPVFENGSNQLEKTYLNYGNSSTTYLSFFTIQKLIKDFWDANLSANVNYTDNQIKSPDGFSSRTTADNINFNFSINNTYYLSTKRKWLAFLLIRYESPVQTVVYKRENSLFTTDLGLRKTINNFSISVYLSDLFNTNGKTTTSYFPNAAYYLNRVYQDNYTRTIALNVRYTFGNKKLNGLKSKKSANEEIKNRL